MTSIYENSTGVGEGNLLFLVPESSLPPPPAGACINRGYYTVARRYEFYVRVARTIHRIHKWRTRGKKLVPSHESEALEDKQTSQMKTFSELAECLARIPPKITFYGLLFTYNYVGCLLLLVGTIFKETG